jgi:hypothetical protein
MIEPCSSSSCIFGRIEGRQMTNGPCSCVSKLMAKEDVLRVKKNIQVLMKNQIRGRCGECAKRGTRDCPSMDQPGRPRLGGIGEYCSNFSFTGPWRTGKNGSPWSRIRRTNDQT